MRFLCSIQFSRQGLVWTFLSNKDAAVHADFIDVLEKCMEDMLDSQMPRVKKVIKQANAKGE
jgi:hypothetical protein